MNEPTQRSGFARADLIAVLAAGVLLAGFTGPTLELVRCDAKKAASMSNLQALAKAHAAYAGDWNDRQFTVVRDDLGAYDGDCAAYKSAAGPHPPLVLGEDCDGATWGFFFDDAKGGSCGAFDVVRPINFYGPLYGVGAFRIPNARGFHEYVDGRFFDPTFFAPKDGVVLDVVEPLLDVDCEYSASEIGGLVYASSYVLSPAAMYDPDVFRSPADGGFQSPDGLDDGYASPSVSQCLYPAQKSRMIEHHLLQTPREPCNPVFGSGTVGECEPYYFNHDFRSIPLALFYDGHVRGFS
ncbi:MAG: hypothetical protein ACYTJ0_01125, partial [Planctomycetota bacterium]